MVSGNKILFLKFGVEIFGEGELERDVEIDEVEEIRLENEGNEGRYTGDCKWY